MDNLRSSSSRSQMSSMSDNTVNKEEVSLVNVSAEKNWQDWKLPLVPQDKIYKKTTFSKLSFLSNYTIKTVERTFSLKQSFETIQLLSRQEIDKNINNFAFIHIGLVQVAVKPLTRQGLNTSVFLGLRDGRFTVYQDALLGMVESSLYNGPIYFDCYPNFSVSLKDKTVSKTLELDVETYGYNMHEGAQPLVIVYRIYYKLMKTTLEPQALMESQKGKTLLLQASTSDSHVKVPTQIEWKDVKLPNRWLLKNVAESIPVQNNLEEDLDYIEQRSDGSVSINFLPYRKSTSSCSARYSNPYIEKTISPPRCSFSKFKSHENSRVDDDLRHSVDRLDNLRFTELEDRSQKLDLDKIRKLNNNSNHTNPNLDGIIKGNVINTPFYSPASQVSQVPPTYHSTYSQPPQQRPNSPTNSDMGFYPPNMYDPQINMIRKPFVLNKEKLRQDFNSPKYENRRKEFFATFSEFLRSYIRNKYYEFMNDIQTEVNFFAWFDHYFKPKLLAGSNTNNSLNFLRQKEVTQNSQDTIIKHKSTYDTSYRHNNTLQLFTDNTSYKGSLTKQNSLQKENFQKENVKLSLPPYNYSHSQANPPNGQTLTKKHANSSSISSDNIPFATTQTLMVINNTSQQDNKDSNKKQMQTINRTTQNWLKVENKEVVHEEFPPYESIVVNHRNHQLVASPIKKVSLSDEAKNFEKIIEQNNYSNTYLKVIGAKLDRIENKINPIKPTTKLDIEKPLFTPHEIPPKLRVSFKKDNTDLLEEISKRLQNLDMTSLASSSQNNQVKIVNTIEKKKQERSKVEEYIENLQNQFKDLNINRIANERDFHGKPLRSRIARTRYPGNVSITRNFYSRPTPPDLQFEERELTVRNAYNAESLYEWNIDGMSQYEILNELHEMLMVSNVYKGNNKTDHQIASIIITGFTGQLKGWWDNTLTDTDRNWLTYAYKRTHNGTPIVDENGLQIQDAVNALVFAITKHFVGDPADYRESAYDSLENLKCYTLSDFRWYKDVFLSKVLIRPDNAEAFWKEKFISGLPHYFAYKVREKLFEKGHTDYAQTTYGEIICTIQKVGLNLCNDLRMTHQLEKEKKYAKLELGNFCEQFGYSPLKTIAPSRQRRKQQKLYKNSYKNYNSNKRNKPYKFYNNKPYKNSNFRTQAKNVGKQKDRTPVCYRCGKSGHFQKNCKVKKEINKIDISKYSTEQLKDKFLQILQTDSENESNDSLADNASDNEIFQIENSSESSCSENSSEEGIELCHCNNKDFCSCKKTINVLSKSEQIIFELIDKIEDPQIKFEYLKKISQIDHQETPLAKPDKTKYNYTNISDMFKKQKAQVTIQDLQLEINSIKQEIREIRVNSQTAYEQFSQEISALKLGNNKQVQIPSSSEIEDKLQDNDDIEYLPKSSSTDLFINLIERVIFQKWYTEVQIVVNKEYYFTIVALLDSGADSNCIQEGLIPAKYYEKTTEGLSQASGTSLSIDFGLPNAHVHRDGIFIQTTFALVKNITNKVILGNPFITLLYPIREISEKGLTTQILDQEVIFPFVMPSMTQDINLLKEISFSKELNSISEI
jgi:hypothetical protein